MVCRLPKPIPRPGRSVTDTSDKPRWFRSLSVGAAFLVAALIASRATSSWIASAFPNRPLPPDLLFEILPHIPKAGYFTDFAVAAALVLLLVYAFRGNEREIPAMMALIGLMYLMRAFINVLTPMASPLNHGTYYGMSVPLEHAFRSALAPVVAPLRSYGIGVSSGVMHLSQNGEFPSGHMGVVFLCMLLVDKAKAPRIKAAMVVLVVVECVSLLISHQHYSIDIVGGILLSYFIYHEYTEGTLLNWLKPLVTV